MGEYLVDRDTGKMELHFDKSEYFALPDNIRGDVKRYFNFSRSRSAWVSKGQANTWAPQEIVKKLGYENKGEVGEKKTFAERMEAKAERAEAKAERYGKYSSSAEKRAKSLRSDWDKYRQDIAFVTQPGHIPFRDKIVKRLERSWKESQKADYFTEQSERLSKVASQSQLKNPVYLDNRIRQGEANLKKLQRDSGEYKRLGRETPEWLENKAADELEKLTYFKKAMSEIGGVKYSQDNIKKGDRVFIRHGWAIVKNTGPKNINVVIAEGGAKGFELKYPYAEIKKHEKSKIPVEKKSALDIRNEMLKPAKTQIKIPTGKVQTERGYKQDLRMQHSIVIDTTNPKYNTWLRYPGKMDVQGIDTKRVLLKSVRKPKKLIRYKKRKRSRIIWG